MRLLAIDFGTKKCGIAISDPLQIIAQPLKVIFYQSHDFNYLFGEIKLIIKEYEPIEKIIIGITKNIDGKISNTGGLTMKFAKFLKQECNLEIVLFDEKYTTKASLEVMKEMKVSIHDRKQMKDAIAAQKILENYMSLDKKNSF